MNRSVRFLTAGVLLTLACGPAVRAAEPAVPRPTREQFDRLHTLIRPLADEEKWLQIPWLTDLWQARQKAAKEGKPILLWEMDGSPLACG